MKKVLLLLLTVSALSLSNAQDIRLGLYQDARLAVAKDKTGNYSPFTLDFLTKLKLISNQIGSGTLVVSPMFEYADIEGIYKRYAIDVGFNFNESLVLGLELTPSINYGIQDRGGISWLVFGADLELSIELNDNVRISVLGQAVDRKDLLTEYGENKISLSGFIGLQVQLYKN